MLVHKPSWPLVAVAAELVGLLQLQPGLDGRSLAGFVHWVWHAEPPMTPPLRHALSIALHRLLCRHRTAPAILAAIGVTQPKIYCAAGPETLPAGWLPLGGAGTDAAGSRRRPVVNNDIDKAMMLTAAHGYQFAGMLNHLPPPAAAGAAEGGGGGAGGGGLALALAQMDRAVLDALGVARLSQPSFQVRIQTRGEGEPLPHGASMCE